MALKTVPEVGNVKCANCVGLNGAKLSMAVTSGCLLSEYGEVQVSARKTGVTSLNVRGAGANLRTGHRQS